MALVNNGTSVEMSQNTLPTGYTKPTVTKFADVTYTSELLQINVAKAIVEDAVGATTFDNLLNDGTVGITKQVSDLVTANFDTAGNTVTVYAELSAVRTNLTVAEDLYSNTPVTYRCTVQYFVNIS